MGWLLRFRKDLKERLSLPKESEIPSIFYGNEVMYHKYIEQAEVMIASGREKTEDYLMDFNETYMDKTEELEDSTLKIIKKLKRDNDHDEIKEEKLH